MFFLAVMMVMTMQAETDQKFNPKRFQADLEAYIVKEAHLTTKQAEKFLPLYREMMNSQRALFDEMRQYRKQLDFNDEEACSRAIQRMDNIDVQIRKIQQQYHLKFLAILPARTVMKIIKAEDHFHRQAFRRAAKRGDHHDKKK